MRQISVSYNLSTYEFLNSKIFLISENGEVVPVKIYFNRNF